MGPDRAHDAADRAAGRRIICPMLVIWATGDDLPDLYGGVLRVWRPWATDLRGAALDCGHHMAEERPDPRHGQFPSHAIAGEGRLMARSREAGLCPINEYRRTATACSLGDGDTHHNSPFISARSTA